MVKSWTVPTTNWRRWWDLMFRNCKPRNHQKISKFFGHSPTSKSRSMNSSPLWISRCRRYQIGAAWSCKQLGSWKREVIGRSLHNQYNRLYCVLRVLWMNYIVPATRMVCNRLLDLALWKLLRLVLKYANPVEYGREYLLDDILDQYVVFILDRASREDRFGQNLLWNAWERFEKSSGRALGQQHAENDFWTL